MCVCVWGGGGGGLAGSKMEERADWGGGKGGIRKEHRAEGQKGGSGWGGGRRRGGRGMVNTGTSKEEVAPACLTGFTDDNREATLLLTGVVPKRHQRYSDGRGALYPPPFLPS